MKRLRTEAKTAIIIGSGLGGLASACLLSKAGWKVTLLEKNEQLGGRVGTFSAKGFRFDAGPSWYLMPDVFEHFFGLLGEDINKHLRLKKLAPSYRVFYKGIGQKIDIYSDARKDSRTFEQIEAGAGQRLQKYLEQAAYQYGVAKQRFLYKNYDSIYDFFTWEMMSEGIKLNVLSNMHRHAAKYFKNEQLQKIIEYPAVFLGSSPRKTPAIYKIMNHVDLNMGVFYPAGGMYKIVEVLAKIAREHGAKLQTSSPVKQIIVEAGKATGVILENGQSLRADTIISNADIHHTETRLLAPTSRSKSEKYWDKRTLAPSALVMYLGVRGKLPSLSHHNLVFSKGWEQNFKDMFDPSGWPLDPSFYVCCPSKNDKTVAPAGHENLFVLVPVAAGVDYTTKQLEKYAAKILLAMESELGLPGLGRKIVYKRLFCAKDFASRYNSYRGSALGLAHTLRQTAAFRPANISKKVKNLYYVGAGTNPGIGMPTALISAELLYKRLAGDRTPGPLEQNRFKK